MVSDHYYTPREDMELLRTSAVAAGIIASGFFRREIKSWTKDNASPVTEADYTVDQFLTSTLRTARPDYGWLSEETADDQSRLHAKRVFIVDPIDGTRAFMRGEDCWSVSLAVVEDGLPIAGVVYAPARDEMFMAARGQGAHLNGQALKKSNGHTTHKPVIPAPPAVHHKLQDHGLDYVRGPSYPSLAYRLSKVATGKLDAAVARRGANDWDVAAAALILEESGISIEDVCVGPLRFNHSHTRHGALAAIADESLRAVLHNVLRDVYGCPEDMDGDLTLQEHNES